MQSLEVFMSRLIPQVQGCPLPLAQQALIDAAIDFCEQTCVVTVITEPVRLFDGQSQYDLDLPRDTVVSRVLQAWVGSTPLYLAGGPDLNTFIGPAADVLAGNHLEPKGSPRAAWYDGETLNLVPTPGPTELGRLTTRLAIKPTIAATQVHNDLAFRWTNAVVDGALYRLAQMSGQAFSDSATAGRARLEYERALGRARIESNRATTAPNFGVRAGPFA